MIKVYDAYHEAITDRSQNLSGSDYDRRWVKIRRPTVVVGGELTMDNLEIRHDPYSNISEAPLQMKSNCGCLLIDDFGRQRIEPVELLNRWIVPLECRHDFLTLSTGKKIQVPFEQLIIFSTNLEPADLVDDAFLRRIPYKIEIGDPDREEFHTLFQLYAQRYQCEYRPELVDYLIERTTCPPTAPCARCHPRDLLGQIRNYCNYNGLPMEMRTEYFDRVVKSYFTVVINRQRARPPRCNWAASFFRFPSSSSCSGSQAPALVLVPQAPAWEQVCKNLNPEPQNPEPRTPNPEPRTPNPEPRTLNPEPRTLNPSSGSRTPNIPLDQRGNRR